MSIYIADCETTGTSKEDQIIQLAHIQIPDDRETLLKYQPEDNLNNRKIVKRVFCSYYKPDVPIQKKAQEIHGISRMKLLDKPSSLTVTMPKDIKILIGHNISFDKRFLSYTDDNHILKDVKSLCTLKLSREYNKITGNKIANNSLTTIYNHFYPKHTLIRKDGFHDALQDCEMTLLVLIAYMKLLPVIKTVTELQKYLEK